MMVRQKITGRQKYWKIHERGNYKMAIATIKVPKGFKVEKSPNHQFRDEFVVYAYKR